MDVTNFLHKYGMYPNWGNVDLADKYKSYKADIRHITGDSGLNGQSVKSPEIRQIT